MDTAACYNFGGCFITNVIETPVHMNEICEEIQVHVSEQVKKSTVQLLYVPSF